MPFAAKKRSERIKAAWNSRLPRPMAEPTNDADKPLAERLLAGEGRALARAISLVENREAAGDELVAELYPRTGNARDHRPHGPPGVGKSTLIGALTKSLREDRQRGWRALGRPVEPVHARRRPGRPHPPFRPLPRPGRLHPLDGHPRLARRPRRGRAAGGAPDGRLGQGLRAGRDRGSRAGRDRRRRPRRHDRARADARLGRLDPGAEGRGDGDPRRDRGQQVRPSARRHHGPRGAGGAGAGPRSLVAGARS